MSGSEREIELLAGVPGSAGLYARAALSSVGRPGAGAGLPDRQLVVTGVEQEVDRLVAYTRVCGFTLRDRVPPTWLHVLTFPLQLQLMTARDFPFAVVGMVHVANRMTLHRPVTLEERLTLTVHAADLRPHRAGAVLDIVEQVVVEDQVVWDGASTYLVKGARIPGPERADTTEPAEQVDAVAPTTPTALWRLPADLGRDYGSVSGDVNPIHLNPLAAKAFGFPRTIAHGMWSHARVLAALEARLPEAYTATVEFRKPVLLPSTVAFGARRAEDGWAFAVTAKDGSRDHLRGRITPA